MSTTTIKPTVGRVVLIFFAAGTPVDGYALPAAGTPLAGLITYVHNDICINVAAFDVYGANLPLTSVRLLQDGDERPDSGCWAEWMPYQKQQAEKQASELTTAAAPQLITGDASDASIERDIQAKGKTAPRVTPADIEANIADEAYFTAADGVRGSTPGGLRTYVPRDSHKLLTFCVLVLQNGFTVTGESACASPENFDAEIGRNIARQNAVQKIWPLMGYALKQQLHLAAYEPPAPGAAHAGYSTLQPHQQRVVDEKCELDARLAKLVPFFDTPIFAGLAEEEKQRLERQEDAMKAYSEILTERIAAFTVAASAPV
ncbi:Gp49 family protein [Massilia sp. WF1]|uniref:Gp49 family protein n=1 Tax=unclassified Massilia TaxID=2609279 RepID=UPI0009E8DFE0